MNSFDRRSAINHDQVSGQLLVGGGGGREEPVLGIFNISGGSRCDGLNPRYPATAKTAHSIDAELGAESLGSTTAV